MKNIKNAKENQPFQKGNLEFCLKNHCTLSRNELKVYISFSICVKSCKKLKLPFVKTLLKMINF